MDFHDFLGREGAESKSQGKKKKKKKTFTFGCYNLIIDNESMFEIFCAIQLMT